MISATISPRVKELLISGLVSESPIESLGDKTFLKFDSITFDKNIGRVTFSFEGKECFYAEYSVIDTFSAVMIDGIDGKIQVKFTDGIMK